MKAHGRGHKREGDNARKVGYYGNHAAIDDRSRIVYSEFRRDEKAATAAGVWWCTTAWYRGIGFDPQSVNTDNDSCYCSGICHRPVNEPGRR